MVFFYLHRPVFISTKLRSRPQMWLTSLFWILVVTRRSVSRGCEKDEPPCDASAILYHGPPHIPVKNWGDFSRRSVTGLSWYNALIILSRRILFSAADNVGRLSSGVRYSSAPLMLNFNRAACKNAFWLLNNGISFVTVEALSDSIQIDEPHCAHIVNSIWTV